MCVADYLNMSLQNRCVCTLLPHPPTYSSGSLTLSSLHLSLFYFWFSPFFSLPVLPYSQNKRTHRDTYTLILKIFLSIHPSWKHLPCVSKRTMGKTPLCSFLISSYRLLEMYLCSAILSYPSVLLKDVCAHTVMFMHLQVCRYCWHFYVHIHMSSFTNLCRK